MSATGMPLLEDSLLTGIVSQFPYDARQYPGLQFFPREGGGTDEIKWDIVVGERGMAILVQLDAEGKQISRDAVKQGRATPMYMKEFHRLLDSELSLLRAPGATGEPGSSGNPEKAELARNRMTAKLRARQLERENWACLQCLANGTLVYNRDGLVININYGFPILTPPSTSWADGSGDHTPIKNVRGWIEEFADGAGYPPDAVFYNPKVLEDIETSKEWKDLVKANPGLAQQVLAGSTQPMVIGNIPLVWIPITGKYVDDSGSLVDRWPADGLSFANLGVNEGLPFARWMVLETNENGYSANPAAWSWDGEGTQKAQVYIASSDNGLPVVYNQNRVQRVNVKP